MTTDAAGVPFSQLPVGDSFLWNQQTFQKASDFTAQLTRLASGSVPALRKEFRFDQGTIVNRSGVPRKSLP